MNKLFNFSRRNFKEIFRDPVVYIFCLGFPVLMLLLFNIINKYTNNNTPMFNLQALLPAIIMFSYTFVMLSMSLLVSKDRQTFFLKRLFSSPMKFYHFVLGYFLVGFVIGLCQTLICIISAYILALSTNVQFISFSKILLLIISQLPILVTFVFLGILVASIFNDKSAPGFCSVLISLAGMLGGCWMPLDTMGNFELFCRFLPFYPSVYMGRITTEATKALGATYTFDGIAIYGIITIFIYMFASIILSVLAFKKSMSSDK